MNLTMMIKPASSLCNLRCRYCFYHDEAQNRETASYGIMSNDTINTIIDKSIETLSRGSNTLSFVFQGGEPMLAGIDFYRYFEERLLSVCPKNISVSRCIQTNGTLITPEWAQFFKKYNYLVGVSLDGYPDIHNSMRFDANGNGSFDAVSKGIDFLNRENVTFNILSVITKNAAQHGTKIYRFLKKNGWKYMQFIPCMDSMDGVHNDFSLNANDYGKFLIDTFNEYYNDTVSGRYISVRWFDNLIDVLRGGMPESCGMTGICSCHFIIEADGSVYPCDFYAGDEYRMGNINDMSFKQLFESEAARKFVSESFSQTEKCQSCKWFGICRGGCRRYRAKNADGTLGQNTLCEAFDMFFTECAPRLGILARQRL